MIVDNPPILNSANVRQWRPHAGQQTRFLACPAFEVLFGGAAGPGKTECLVVGALRQVENPRYNGIILRRTFARLELADGPIARSERYYPSCGGKYNGSKHYWQFPSGARIYFGHMEHEHDKDQYQSSQFAYVAFDELTEFLFTQYYYMFTRCRVDPDTRLVKMLRAASNPGGIGHEWVKERFITRDIVNQVKWFAMIGDADTRVARTHDLAMSRAFFPALLKDNPSADPSYLKQLLNNPDPIERARLAAGDWDIEVTEGRIYPNWSSVRNVSELAEYDPSDEHYWTVDDGYKNPRVILFCQIRPNGTVTVFDEYYQREQTALQTLQFIHNGEGDSEWHYAYPKPEFVVFDPSAIEFAANCWEFNLYTEPGDNRVQEGIKLVRSYVQDENGVVSLLVHPRCVNLIREMTLYMADLKKRVQGSDPPPIKDNDHCPDALRYFIATAVSPLPK